MFLPDFGLSFNLILEVVGDVLNRIIRRDPCRLERNVLRLCTHFVSCPTLKCDILNTTKQSSTSSCTFISCASCPFSYLHHCTSHCNALQKINAPSNFSKQRIRHPRLTYTPLAGQSNTNTIISNTPQHGRWWSIVV